MQILILQTLSQTINIDNINKQCALSSTIQTKSYKVAIFCFILTGLFLCSKDDKSNTFLPFITNINKIQLEKYNDQ